MDNEQPAEQLEPLINEDTLAEWLRCRPYELRRLREQRKGPPFVMVGRWPLYRRRDVDQWLDQVTAASVASVPGTTAEESGEALS